MSLAPEPTPVAERPESLSPFGRDDLSLLDAVGQSGDLGEVARRTGTRHAAVQRQLDRLDRAVGVPLTLRSHHTARLTSAGQRLLVAGRRFFHQIDLAARVHLLGHGTEAVDAPEVLSIASGEPLLEEVVEDAAALLGLLLSVRYEAPHRVAGQLTGYHVDAVYTWGLDPQPPSWDRTLRAHDVLDDPLWVILPRDHPLAVRETVSLAELRDETWVSETGPACEILVARVFQSAGLPAPARLRVTDASVARGVLRRGDAIGLGSPAQPAVLDPSLVRRSLAERPYRTTRLLVDPTVMPGTVARRLAGLIADRQLRRFAEHHQDLLDEEWWARWYEERSGRLTGGAPDPGPAPAPAEARKLDLADLRLLRAVAAHGSINRAAAVLSISQSALTRRIHRLERSLGAPLLLRSPRGTELTTSTRRFLRGLARYEAEFRVAAASCRTVGPPPPRDPWPARPPTAAGRAGA
ncbi:LysR family transcriptional regulator [Streptomyces sp. NPDC093085]|uniref:LysR family transcriptional regulator n=1 Tax=Streptomyces sp. NPDC093085 TaxID=3155068 RepID=UPI0034325101